MRSMFVCCVCVCVCATVVRAGQTRAFLSRVGSRRFPPWSYQRPGPVRHLLRKPEVSDLHVAILVDQDILRLQVPAGRKEEHCLSEERQ